MHGNPSGIDNAVATRGGAVVFARAFNGNPGKLESVTGYVPSPRSYQKVADAGHRFQSIRLLLTDSRIPRDTKTLVAGVSAMKLAEPELVGGILRSIQAISDQAHGSLADSAMERSDLIETLEVSLLFDT